MNVDFVASSDNVVACDSQQCQAGEQNNTRASTHPGTTHRVELNAGWRLSPNFDPLDRAEDILNVLREATVTSCAVSGSTDTAHDTIQHFNEVGILPDEISRCSAKFNAMSILSVMTGVRVAFRRHPQMRRIR